MRNIMRSVKYSDSTGKFVLLLLALLLIKVIIFSLTVVAPNIEARALSGGLFFLISNVGILVFFLSFILLLPGRTLQVVYGISLNLVVSTFIIGSRIYHLFFNNYISIDTIFSYISANSTMHSQSALSMTDTLLSAMPLWDILWFADIPLVLFVVFRYWQGRGEVNQVSRPLTFFKLMGISLLVLLVVLNTYTERHFLAMVDLKYKGILTYYLQESANFLLSEKEEFSLEEDVNDIKRWFWYNRSKNKGQEFFGMAANKNLILLQIEALQNNVIFKKIDGQEITPNLNRIIGESLYFENCYNQVDMATADAEVLANLSLYPIPNVCIYMAYEDNTFNSLANQLKGEGYSTAVYHGFERTFYNREDAYPNVGFDKYFSRRHYRQDEVHNELLGDKTFLKQTAEMLADLQEPYYAFIYTLTSHHPFNFLEDYDGIDPGIYEDTIVGDYIRSIHYTDAAIGEFYDSLKNRGILDESLLVIYGDHLAFNYNERDQEALQDFCGADIKDPLVQLQEHKVPLILRLPGMKKKGVISDSVGMIDIYPTVISLLGYRNPYLMGRDVLNTEEDLVILKNGSFVKGMVFFSATNYQLYNLHAGEVEILDDSHELLLKARETRRISELIFKRDFFAH